MAATGVRSGAQRRTSVPRRTETQGRPTTLTVVSKRKSEEQTRRRRARAMFVLVAGVIGAALFLIGMGQNLLGTQQVRLDNLQQELTVATQKNADLLLTRAQLSAPAHILQLAEHKLGMVTPPTVAYLKPVAIGQTVAQRGKEPSVATN